MFLPDTRAGNLIVASVFCDVSKFWLCHLLAVCSEAPKTPEALFHGQSHVIVYVSWKFQNLFPENSPSNKPLSSSGVVWVTIASDSIGKMLRTSAESHGVSFLTVLQSFGFILPTAYQSLVHSLGVWWHCLHSREVHTSSLQTLHCLGELSLLLCPFQNT